MQIVGPGQLGPGLGQGESIFPAPACHQCGGEIGCPTHRTIDPGQPPGRFRSGQLTGQPPAPVGGSGRIVRAGFQDARQRPGRLSDRPRTGDLRWTPRGWLDAPCFRRSGLRIDGGCGPGHGGSLWDRRPKTGGKQKGKGDLSDTEELLRLDTRSFYPILERGDHIESGGNSYQMVISSQGRSSLSFSTRAGLSGKNTRAMIPSNRPWVCWPFTERSVIIFSREYHRGHGGLHHRPGDSSEIILTSRRPATRTGAMAFGPSVLAPNGREDRFDRRQFQLHAPLGGHTLKSQKGPMDQDQQRRPTRLNQCQ